MADQGHEYEQFTPQTGGRLFSSAMFGFNKEEVLEYLDEVADENYQRQEVAEMKIQELSQKVQNLETAAAATSVATASPELEGELANRQQQIEKLSADLAEQQTKVQEMTRDLELRDTRLNDMDGELDIVRTATQQSEGELQEIKEQLHTSQQENAWLREEYQKSDHQIADLRRQLDEVSSGHLTAAEQQVTDLQQHLEQLAQQNAALDTQLSAASNAAASALDEANHQIATLKSQLTEANATVNAAVSPAALTEANQQIADLQRQLSEASNTAAGAAEEELNQLRDQLEAATTAQWAAEDQATELRQQLEDALDQLDEEQQSSNPTSAAIIAEANAEADRILEQAYAERDRLHRQIRSSAGGLAESITNLRAEVSDVEGDVSEVLELVQNALADVLVALGRTEQNLNIMGVQVDRFPSASSTVPKPQQVVYFQPGAQISPQNHPGRRKDDQPAASQSYGQGNFHRVTSSDSEGGNRQHASNVRPFRPTYSTSQGYWPQGTAAANPQEDPALDDQRMRTLTETLVETLRQMMN